MNNYLFIYPHLGLGDQIICNGLIREIIKIHNTVEVFYIVVKPDSLESVKFMYRDIINVEFCVVNCDEAFTKFIYNNNIKNNVITIGHQPWHHMTWDESFYYTCSVDFNCRWSSFYVHRDIVREHKLFVQLNPLNEEYCLIHKAGGDKINRLNTQYIPTNLKHIYIEPQHTDNVFDYLELIEKAAEIHCIDSSFHLLVDTVYTHRNKLFLHDALYKRSPSSPHIIKKQWVEV